MVLGIGPKECACSIKCLAKWEDWLAVLKSFLCSQKLVAKNQPVCPTYAFPQSGHVNLYTPDCECISVFCCLCINCLCMVLLVRKAIFMLVFLNRLVMKLVSFPMYVEVAHFVAGVCVRVFVNCFLLVTGGGCGVGGWIGKALLCRMFLMVITSAL
jgi:hypothetical protein